MTNTKLNKKGKKKTIGQISGTKKRFLLPNNRKRFSVTREKPNEIPPPLTQPKTKIEKKSGQAKYRENQQAIAMELSSINTKMEPTHHVIFGSTILVNGTPLENYSAKVLFNFLLWKGYVLGREGRSNKDLLIQLFKDWFDRKEGGRFAVTAQVRVSWQPEKEINELKEKIGCKKL